VSHGADRHHDRGPRLQFGLHRAGRGDPPGHRAGGEPDEIIALGAIVAEELYGLTMPVVVVDEATLARVAGAKSATLDPTGAITLG